MYRIDSIDGNCPVEGCGTVDGKPFYFRARGSYWHLSVGDDPIGNPDFIYGEPYGDEPFSAGWMNVGEARDFIDKAIMIYIEERDADGSKDKEGSV